MDKQLSPPPVCPRCHEHVPDGAYLEPLATCLGWGHAYRLRHEKANGRWCVAYLGAPAASASDHAAVSASPD
jgi:hypothetical protein